MADNDSVLKAASVWAGKPMAIATVVSTWGSAPRPRGSHMLVHADGRFEGSVSGGCVESDILATAADVIAGAPFVVKRYGVEDAAAWEVGLPCGGEIAVMVQPVSAAGFDPELFAALAEARDAGKAAVVTTDLDTGASSLRPVEGAAFVNRYDPPRRLLIVGAVQIAQSLAGLARELGILTVVIDPRARFLTEERFPGVMLDDRWPDEAVAASAPGPSTAVVTLSHDVKIDDPAVDRRASHRCRLCRGAGIAPQPRRPARTTDRCRPRGVADRSHRWPGRAGYRCRRAGRDRAVDCRGDDRRVQCTERCKVPRPGDATPGIGCRRVIRAAETVLILLAAGRSERFGTLDKLTQDYLGKPLAFHVVTALEDVPFRERIVVQNGTELDFAARGYRIIHNDRPEIGMSNSVKLGIAHAARHRRSGGADRIGGHATGHRDAHPSSARYGRRARRGGGIERRGKAMARPRYSAPTAFPPCWSYKGDAGARDMIAAGKHVIASEHELLDIDRPADLDRLRAFA